MCVAHVARFSHSPAISSASQIIKATLKNAPCANSPPRLKAAPLESLGSGTYKRCPWKIETAWFRPRGGPNAASQGEKRT